MYCYVGYNLLICWELYVQMKSVHAYGYKTHIKMWVKTHWYVGHNLLIYIHTYLYITHMKMWVMIHGNVGQNPLICEI